MPKEEERIQNGGGRQKRKSQQKQESDITLGDSSKVLGKRKQRVEKIEPRI